MKIKHKILLLLSCISLVLMMISGVMWTNESMRLENSQSAYKILIENKKNANKSIYNSTDIDELKEKLNNIKNEYSLLCFTDNEAVETAKKYITIRYQFDGSPKDNKNKIVNGLYDIVTDDFRERISDDLSRTAAGNGFVSDDFKHTCKILNIYVTNGYEVGPSNDYKAAEKYEPVYNKDVYAKLHINNSYTAICKLTLTKDNKENSCWKVDYEYLPAMRFD